jgi:hypothetical protein
VKRNHVSYTFLSQKLWFVLVPFFLSIWSLT